MTTLANASGNQKKMADLVAVLGELLSQVLQRGFHGTAMLEVTIQDGSIQTIRRRIEQIEK